VGHSTAMNYAVVGEKVSASYKAVFQQYRRDDEIEVASQNHRHLSGILRDLTTAFPHPVRVLEAGCGTGRYFHCLKNVEELVGLDVCPEMLQAAEHPVLEDEITVPNIRLMCENIYLASLRANFFHVIYSLGMFGNGCPVTPEILGRFHAWLAPGGKLFFNVVDEATLMPSARLKRRVKRVLYPVLPDVVQKTLDERESRMPFFGLTKSALEQIMKQTAFSSWQIHRHVCQSPLWQGVLLECRAQKTQLPEAR
jgi:SAM-dependent methyltransferase